MQQSLTALLKKPVKINTFALVFVFLLVVIFLELLQIFSQNKELSLRRRASLNSENRITELEQEKVRVGNQFSVPQIINYDLVSSGKSGWVQYSNEKLGIRFEYPIDMVKLQELRQTNEEKEIITLSFFTKKTTDLHGREVLLLQFSTAYSPMTYGDVNTPDSIEKGAFELQGKKYDIYQYVMGEGSPCGGGSLKTQVIKLRENLMLYKIQTEQQRNKDRKNCVGDAYDEFKTPAQDLQLVESIIKTIEFE